MNKVLLLIVITVFLVVCVLIFNLSTDSSDAAAIPAKAIVAEAPAKSTTTVPTEADKDTYINTIKTISAQVTDLQNKMKEMGEEQKATKEAIPKSTEIDKSVADKVVQNVDDLRRELKGQVDTLRDSVERKFKQRQSRDSSSKNGSDIPNGLGFDDFSAHKVSLSNNSFTGWSTVTPMGSGSNTPGTFTPSKVGENVSDWYANKLNGSSGKDQQEGKSSVSAPSTKGYKKAKTIDPKDEVKPVYTIPRNATLFDNDTLTGLLGIIPVSGSILDPIRFKIITGATNMATNGLYVPGVRDIVWSGIAIGNREMSCVRGELHSVTFTFEDGTIRTISTGKSSSDTKTASKQILGYISDRQGSPCLRGQLITNAQDYLKDRMIASGIASTAEAFATTQETTVIDTSGGTHSFFSGSSGDYIAGKALSGSMAELSEYMRERARNAVDLVFLEAGQQVVLHIEEQIEIDYDPNGRKLEYANPLSAISTNAYRLD